jgi:hypothetical protein
MRILAAVQGNWGKRKVENIRKNGPTTWSIEVFEPPLALPLIIDDPDEFLPKSLLAARAGEQTIHGISDRSQQSKHVGLSQ